MCPAPTEIYTFPYTTLFRSRTDLPGREERVTSRSPHKAGRGDDCRGTSPRCLSEPRPAAVNPDAFLYRDRKSTRLNSSHMSISYAVFCLKKKKDIEASSYIN